METGGWVYIMANRYRGGMSSVSLPTCSGGSGSTGQA